MSMKSPAFSLDYFPSPEVAWSLFQPVSSKGTTPDLHNQKHVFSWERRDDRLGTYGSAGSSNGPWSSDLFPSESVTPYSTGTSPPKSLRSSTQRSSAIVSYSASPELHQHTRRSHTNLASAFASLSRPFTLTASSSPPSQHKPRTAEADLSTSAPTGGVTWAANTFNASSGQTSPGLRYKGAKRGSVPNLLETWDAGEASDDDYDRHLDAEDDAYAPSRPSSDAGANATVKLTLKNQNMFDDEAHASVPLLDPTQQAKYAAYRTMYADQLTVWGLPIARSEILKFNGLTSYWPDEDKVLSSAPSTSSMIRRGLCVRSILVMPDSTEPRSLKLSSRLLASGYYCHDF